MESEPKFIEKADIDKAYEKAKRLILECSIEMSDFVDLYGEDVIKRDGFYVKEMEERFGSFEDINKKLATIFEAIFMYHAEMSNWMGENAMIAKTSRYDDIRNGVDMVAEFTQDDESVQHMALAVDITTSDDLIKKFKRIKEEIEKGELARIKYYKSEDEKEERGLSMIPRIIIGASRKTIRKTQEKWMRNNNMDLAKDSIQFQILEETLMQLKAFAKYSEKVDNFELVAVYEKHIKIIKKVMREKSDLAKETGSDERDEVFSAIRYYVENFETI